MISSACSSSPAYFVTAANDCTVCVWDKRSLQSPVEKKVWNLLSVI